jgi:hypothetical protein
MIKWYVTRLSRQRSHGYVQVVIEMYKQIKEKDPVYLTTFWQESHVTPVQKHVFVDGFNFFIS